MKWRNRRRSGCIQILRYNDDRKQPGATKKTPHAGRLLLESSPETPNSSKHLVKNHGSCSLTPSTESGTYDDIKLAQPDDSTPHEVRLYHLKKSQAGVNSVSRGRDHDCSQTTRLLERATPRGFSHSLFALQSATITCLRCTPLAHCQLGLDGVCGSLELFLSDRPSVFLMLPSFVRHRPHCEIGHLVTGRMGLRARVGDRHHP
jgi:hypothetical protein